MFAFAPASGVCRKGPTGNEMIAPLLTTKLYIPPPRANLVSRPRLVQRMDEGLRLRHKLTLVSAPAGFGKTTLITEWILGSPREIAWLSVDEGDNDPVQLLHYLIAALQPVDGRIGGTVRQILQAAQLPPTQSLITVLVNDISAAASALTLVLDDYQLITSPEAHRVVAFLLEHQPPNMHLIVGTRQDPPLPLPRLRARSQVTEVREQELRFTVEETADFFAKTMDLALSSEAVEAIESRTEGWVTGLQLAAVAALSYEQAPSHPVSSEEPDAARSEALISAFTGDDRYVMDYLVAEVLQRQPEAMRSFLQQTAIVDRLTASLCNALTGREDGQAVLDQLEGTNLFLISIDHRREWYRYHRLFAEVLRTMLDPQEQMILQQKAANWYEGHGYMRQAIKHALAYASASGDLDEAERLICHAADETIHSGSLLTVGRWLDSLPDERVRASGGLATYKGWVLVLTGEIDRAEEYAHAAELCFKKAEAPDKDLGRLLVLRAFIAVFGHQDHKAAIELAADALQMMGEDQAHWRVIALWAMAESQERTTNITEAIATLYKAHRTRHTLGKLMFSVTVDLFLATALYLHGQRQEAVAVCTDALEQHSDESGRPSPVAGMIISWLGMLHYEANQLEQARAYLEQGLALCRQLGLDASLLFAHGYLAPTLWAQGDTKGALVALYKARELATQTGLTEADPFLAREVNMRLQQGDVSFAQQWAQQLGLSPDGDPDYLGIERHVAYARLLLAQGRLSDAQRWLARLESFALERGLYRWLLTVHILQALAAARMGDRPSSRAHLSEAVRIGAPEGFYRAFLDEDEQVLALLPDVRETAPAFVDRLREFVGSFELSPEPGSQPAAAQALVEALSERELEVLALIAAGFSNREIAQKLFIAQGTVKRHINNIYGKMEVRSRTQAVARARELDLL